MAIDGARHVLPAILAGRAPLSGLELAERE
jgi:hypothetical protein